MATASLGIAGGAVLLVALRVMALEQPRTPSLRFDYRHRSLVEDTRAASRQLPVSPTAVVTKGAYTRPSLTHWAVSKLPPDTGRTVYSWLGGVSELVVVAVLVGVGLGSDHLTVAGFGVAALVVLLTPQFVRADRPGNPGFDPTKLGLALSAVGVASMLPWTAGGGVVWLVIAALATGLVVLTDRVALCSHGLAMLAVAVLDPLAVVVLLGGLVIGVVLSGGRAARFLAAHVKFLIGGVRHRHPYAIDGSDWSRFRTQVRERPLRGVPEPVAALVGFNPFVVTGLVTALAGSVGAVGMTPTDAVLAAWLLGSVAGFVLTSVPRLDVAGPPDAYLFSAVVPAAVLTGTGVTVLGLPYLVGVVAAGIVGVALSVMSRRARELTESDEAWRELLDMLNEFEPGVVLLDPSDRATELAFETDHRVADSLHNEEASTEDLSVLFPETHRRLSDEPNVMKNIEYYFNPDWAVFDRTRVDLPDAVPQSADPMYENDRYQLFEFDDLVCYRFLTDNDEMTTRGRSER